MSKKRDLYSQQHSDYYPVVFSTVYSKVGNREDAKDLCQEIFLKFYQKFDDIENGRKWLFGAIRLELLVYYRKKNPDIVNLDEVIQDAGMTFVNGFRDARIIIAEAIENADLFENDLEQALFDLVAIYNYSYSEAGAELGLTKRQVMYRYHGIVEKITAELEKKGIKNIEDLL
jgi:RNA polymerase sigma factor (sigma-70 family)